MVENAVAKGRQLRRELIEASLRYQTNFPDSNAGRSNLHPSLNPEVEADWESLSTQGDAVVSLGSGPDIFRPLFNFPLAAHIHFIDLMAGWDDDADAARRELLRRFEHIGPNSRANLLNTDWEWTRTFTWKLEWDSPSEGPQAKFVSLHVRNYGYPSEVTMVLHQLTPDQMGALFVTGAFLPQGRALSLLLHRLKHSGVLIAEMDYESLLGETSTSGDPLIREQIESAGLVVESRLERSVPPDDIEFTPTFFPRVYRFRKPTPAPHEG